MKISSGNVVMVFFSEQVFFFILLKFPFCKLVASKLTGEKYFI